MAQAHDADLAHFQAKLECLADYLTIIIEHLTNIIIATTNRLYNGISAVLRRMDGPRMVINFGRRHARILCTFRPTWYCITRGLHVGVFEGPLYGSLFCIYICCPSRLSREEIERFVHNVLGSEYTIHVCHDDADDAFMLALNRGTLRVLSVHASRRERREDTIEIDSD